MTRLEEELRGTFAAVTGDLPPHTPDPAGSALRRASRIRRKRAVTALGGVAAVVVLALGLGTAALGRPFAAGPPASRGANTHVEPLAPVLPVDLAVGNELWITEGGRLKLPTPTSETTINRVPGGWLLWHEKEVAKVRFLRPDGSIKTLIPHADQIAIDRDGKRLAWAANGELHAARLVEGTLKNETSALVKDNAAPVGWLGDRVLLRRYTGDNGMEQWTDTWDPAAGPYKPHWNTTVHHIYGPASDPKKLVAAVRRPNDETICLALVDHLEWNVREQAMYCPTTWLLVDGTLSPDGTRVHQPGTKGSHIYELGPMFEGKPPTVVDLGDVFRATWVGKNTLVSEVGGKVVSWPSAGKPIESDLPAASTDPRGWKVVGRHVA